MITYPTIFFGTATGPLKEDFESYSAGALPTYDQVWQYNYHQWLIGPNPNKYKGFTWKDFGVSGAFDDFQNYSFGAIDVDVDTNLLGQGNFEIRPWSGFSAGFYRDQEGKFTSADQLRGYAYINFDWGTNSPINAYKSDYWSAKFVAKLTLPQDGTYRFYVERDEACRIYVGREDGPNNLVFDKWGIPPVSGLEAGDPFTFTSGQIDILIDYYEDTGPAKLKLSWTTPYSASPIPILPSDFGNSGYVRSFTPYRTPIDQGRMGYDMLGVYRLGVVKTDVLRDYGQTSYNFSGNYSLGVVKTDVLKSGPARTSLTHAGYHVFKNQDMSASEEALNQIQHKGFYAYKVAFPSVESDPAFTAVNEEGYYVYKTADVAGLDFAKTQISPQGFHDVAYIIPTKEMDYGLVSTTHDGNYYFKNVFLNYLDQGSGVIRPEGYYVTYLVYNQNTVENTYNTVDPHGAYYPRYLNNDYRDYGRVSVLPSGYHITGYVNTDAPRDFGNTLITHAGHAPYWMVTGDRQTEYTKNTLEQYGIYFYKHHDEREAEPVFDKIEYDGLYFPRYLNNPYAEPASNYIQEHGNYFYKNAFFRVPENVKNIISPAGYHITGFVNSLGIDYSKTTINPVGHYVSGQQQVSGIDFAQNILAPVGNYFYAQVFNRNQDQSCELLSYDGEYKPIYIYFAQAEYTYNKLDAAGQYYNIRKSHSEFDNAFDFLDFDGTYRSRFNYTYDVDPAKNITTLAGYHYTGYLNVPASDLATNRIEIAGNNFFRFVSGNYVEFSKNELDLFGVYFTRFASNYSLDQGKSLYGFDGYNVPRYVNNAYVNPASGFIDVQGLYFSRFAYEREYDAVSCDIGFESGIYYSKYKPHLESDLGYNYLDFAGDLMYVRVPNRTQEPAYNIIGFADASYFSRFVPSYDQDPAKNLLILAGEYLRDSWLTADSSVIEIDFSSEIISFAEIQELTSITASLSGAFTLAKASNTLDYWLEIYQRPTYNMGKSQAYFSI